MIEMMIPEPDRLSKTPVINYPIRYLCGTLQRIPKFVFRYISGLGVLVS